MRIVTFIGVLLIVGCSKEQAASDAPVQEGVLAGKAKPIVGAIYRFHHERGLWPRDLDELDPDYLKRNQSRGWDYQPWYNGRWTLSNFNDDFDRAVRFIHTSDDVAEWKLDFGDTDMSLDVRQELPEFAPVNPVDRKKRRRETLLRRIEQHPNEIKHHQGLVSDLYKEGRFRDARAGCLRCLEHWPTIWWPNLMLALIDLKLGEPDRAEKGLMAWVNKGNTFGHFVIAAYFYHEAGQKEKYFSALRRAEDLPLKAVNVEEWQGTYLTAVEVASLAVEMAYREDQTELCLVLCDRYQRHVEDHYGPKEYYLYRAACLLKQGKQTEARKEVDSASKCRGDCNYGDDAEKLKKAIETGDKSFRYKVGGGEKNTCAELWRIVIDYR